MEQEVGGMEEEQREEVTEGTGERGRGARSTKRQIIELKSGFSSCLVQCRAAAVSWLLTSI